MSALRVGVVGASGYGGVGLVERLRSHPEVGEVVCGSRGYAGEPLAAAWPHLAGVPAFADARFVDPDEALGAEVVFTATPHGATAPLVERARAGGARVIDLSADFRLPSKTYAQWYREHPHPERIAEAVYGLVEIARETLPGAAIVAAPGCNATAVNLALAPLAARGWLGPAVVATVATGASGAGRGVAQGLHYSELAGNARPYKPSGTHRHTAEIELMLGRFDAGDRAVAFTPVLVPMARGIVATVQTRPEALPSERDLAEAYRAFYKGAPMVHVQSGPPETKAVAGSDRAVVAVHRDARSGSVVAFCAIDNLGKGAAGQAVQGFNLAFGFEETLGLRFEGVWP